MKPDEPQDEQTVLGRYRRASEADGARPTEATRAAILAEARRVAGAQSKPDALKPFDTRQQAANQGRWRLAAFGTFGVVVLAALVAVPMLNHPSSNAALAPAAAPSATESRQVTTGYASSGLQPDAPGAPAMAVAPPAPAESPVAADAAPAAGLMARKSSPPADNRLMAQSAPAQRRAEAVQSDKAREQSDKAREAAAADLEEIVVTRQDAKPAAPAAPLANMSIAAARAPRGAPAPVLEAVRAGDLAQLTRLLDQGASLRESDDAGRSPLFLAVMQRRPDLVRALLAHGADPLAADRAGWTPLDQAREEQDEAMVRLLSEPLATH